MSNTEQGTAPASSRLDVMNFLNQIAGEYPAAISLAAGRPAENFFDAARWMAQIPHYLAYFSAQRGMTQAQGMNALAQYGNTNGIVNELIARQIGNDDGIACGAGQILVTAGCQEALALCVRNLCPHADDVILVRSPAYIGISGAAMCNRVEEVPFSCAEPGQMVAELRATIGRCEGRGKRPRVLYLVPDFDNPTGTVLSRALREELIALCAAHEIVVLEDNPYGMFRYAGASVEPMYALDTLGCVVYLGTYSKTLCPTLRVGYAVLPHNLFGDAAAARRLLASLSRDKSFGTLNTSQLTQAAVGAILLSVDCSLRNHVAPVIDFYRNNCQVMDACLTRVFAADAGAVSWNVPEGGFFMVVSLPFPFKTAQAELCARDYGVLVMPLSFFSYGAEHDCQVRLAFSNVTPAQIAEAITRFGRFVIAHSATLELAAA